jgi:hypothetical protein
MKTRTILSAACGTFVMAVACPPAMAQSGGDAGGNYRTSVPNNPYLIQNSFYPIIHYNSSQTDEIGTSYGKGDWQVKPGEINFQPGGLGNPGQAYRKYEDGREAMVMSGPGRVAKYRFDGGRLELVNELKIPGHEKLFLGHDQILELVKALDEAGTDDAKFTAITKAEADRSGVSKDNWPNGMYTLMDKDGYYYAGYGTVLYKFGDEKPGDASSPIKIVASRDIKNDLDPELAKSVSRFLGINITYDGHLVVALAGVIGVVDRELKQAWLAPIPGEAVDNGVVVDDQNGLYTVTDKYMRKLVWKGDKLSTDEADGAWKEGYDWVKKKGSLSRGSGTTPTLMGFGEEDHLVLTVDQGDPVKVVAFWRDGIPEDARQVAGAPSKRTAGNIAISFPVKTTIEWSPTVKGNGVLVFASEFPRLIPTADGKDVDLLSTIFTMGTTVPGPRGAERFEWDKDRNEFVSKWVYQDKGLSWTLSPVSAVDNMVYLNTTEGGLYTLTGLNWDTGKVERTVTLGKSVKFNTGGTFISPLPDGGLFINGFFGPIRIHRGK